MPKRPDEKESRKGRRRKNKSSSSSSESDSDSQQVVSRFRCRCPERRERLGAMSKRDLRLEAEELGVPADDIDAWRDDAMPKDEFIELLVGCMSKKVARRYGVLGPKSKKELRLEAEKVGVAMHDVDAFRDDEMSSDAMMDLIVARMPQCGFKLPELPPARAYIGAQYGAGNGQYAPGSGTPTYGAPATNGAYGRGQLIDERAYQGHGQDGGGVFGGGMASGGNGKTYVCENGCGFEGSWDAVAFHEKGCQPLSERVGSIVGSLAGSLCGSNRNRHLLDQEYGTDEWFTCEYKCGFAGEFDVVSRHERSCEKAPRSGKFVGTLYYCDFQCGFQGAFDAVAAHENLCTRNPRRERRTGHGYAQDREPAMRGPTASDRKFHEIRDRPRETLDDVVHSLSTDTGGTTSHRWDDNKAERKAGRNKTDKKDMSVDDVIDAVDGKPIEKVPLIDVTDKQRRDKRLSGDQCGHQILMANEVQTDPEL